MVDHSNNIPPTVLVIFGATGDLTRRKLIPALFDLFHHQLLPKEFSLIGFARRDWTDDIFRNEMRDSLGSDLDIDAWTQFAARLSYLKSDFHDQEGFERLAQSLDQHEKDGKVCCNRIFYFATPASAYTDILANLKAAHLANFCPIHGAKNVRVVVEKPFGKDLDSARELDGAFLDIVGEDQIYRIDHYLAKETVQNILAFRFANSLFEPIWNNRFIDSVQITAAEAIGVESRGAFYEETGALRDFVQNHLLQLLAAVAMDQPKDLSANEVRASRERLLAALCPIEDVDVDTIRGQYEGYHSESNVDAHSDRETFVALKVFLDSECFRGIPFYLRTGKKLKEKVTDITIIFKPLADSLYQSGQDHMTNTITIRIQPNEGISVRIFTKQPGTQAVVVPTQMDFCYRDAFGEAVDEAYNRLLLDVIAGDQTLFASSAEIEASWQFITPILEKWTQTDQKSIVYPDDSWGPKESDELLTRDGKKWLAEHTIVCPIHEKHTL